MLSNIFSINLWFSIQQILPLLIRFICYQLIFIVQLFRKQNDANPFFSFSLFQRVLFLPALRSIIRKFSASIIQNYYQLYLRLQKRFKYLIRTEIINNHFFQMEHTDQQILEILNNSRQAKKSSKELSQLVYIIFGSPQMLSKKFVQTNRKKQQQPPNYHNLDISQIEKVYESINLLGKNSDISKCLEKSFEKLQQEGELKAFLQSNNQFRYFFILLLWTNLFTDNGNNLLLMKCLNFIAHAPSYMIVLSHWLDDITIDRMTNMVVNIQRKLQGEFEKLQPGIIDQSLIKIVELNVKNMCTFLKLLYNSNNRVKRIPKQAFINEKIPEYFQPIYQFKLFLRKIQDRNFIQFPFMLPLDYKSKLLQIQSLFEQKTQMQKSLNEGVLSNMILMENFSLQGLIFLHFTINRNNILDDSMEKLGKTTHNLKSPMKIQFVGQQGSDEGGVKNQYFQLLVKQIFNPYLDMFIPKNKGRVYWFNAYSYEAPIRFQFVGMLLGLAIYNNVLLDIKFPRMVYHKLLEKQETQIEITSQLFHLLIDIQPEIAKSLKYIYETHEPLDGLHLFFNIQYEHFGQKILEELVQQGNHIPVNQDNKNFYVQLYIDHLFNKHIEKQFKAFKRGFRRVVSGSMISLFQPEELQTIICGIQNMDFKDLQEGAGYEGYDRNSPVIKNLWDLLHSFNQQQKKAFLIFLTGTDRVPIQGLKSLGMMIQKSGANTAHLPTAHTCFNVLLLPDYQSKKILQQKLRLAMKNNQGFGLI